MLLLKEAFKSTCYTLFWCSGKRQEIDLTAPTSFYSKDAIQVL